MDILNWIATHHEESWCIAFVVVVVIDAIGDAVADARRKR